MIFHPLSVATADIPVRMNNPFYYEPDALCRTAANEVQCRIAEATPDFKAEVDQGKMFGVLIVRWKGALGYLACSV